MRIGGPRALRAMNDRASLQALALRGPMSRTELADEIGVSRPAAAELLRRLEQAQLVRPDGHQEHGGPGPNARLWRVNENRGHAVGVDVTTTSIDLAIVDLTGATVFETTLTGTTDDPIADLRRAVLEGAATLDLQVSELSCAVVGISGSIDPATGLLAHAEHMPQWLGFDVPARLSEALGIPVTVENDVNLVVVDEFMHGCARGRDDVLLLWMDQGVAAAIIVGGRVHRGARGAAGEIDAAPIGPDGVILGRLVDSVGVLALASASGVAATEASAAVRAATTAEDDGTDASTAAARFLTELAARIAQTLVIPVSLLDPQLVVLAGDIGVAGGDRLAGLVTTSLHGLVDNRPEVTPATGRADAVRHGAVDAAVRQMQEEIFG
ncbi:ROK family transcriptional regulator [Aestuariimicrobium kwangyangense]|uniref:ROK family transcriptional regulator n=1 Tax=Aestuariimicrobium kwangyangense TaxID=396389 RepID=UPI00041AE759|nr:ROK family transcriptional regulator [Aestuariimicrobium kwangyangense]